jgi:hypothetical protein
MHTRLPLVLATLGLSLPIPLTAQEPPSLVPWQRVRVTAPAAGLVRNVFAILSVTTDSVILVRQLSPARLDTVRLPRTALQTLEVSLHRGSYALAGLGVGLAVGGVVAARWATKTANPSTGPTFGPELDNVPGILVIVGVAGLAGAIGGGLIHTEKWSAVPLDRLRLGPPPLTAGRLGFGPAFSF